MTACPNPALQPSAWGIASRVGDTTNLEGSERHGNDNYTTGPMYSVAKNWTLLLKDTGTYSISGHCDQSVEGRYGMENRSYDIPEATGTWNLAPANKVELSNGNEEEVKVEVSTAIWSKLCGYLAHPGKTDAEIAAIEKGEKRKHQPSQKIQT